MLAHFRKSPDEAGATQSAENTLSDRAKVVLANLSISSEASAIWGPRFTEILEVCDCVSIYTHIPFIATILLAKATDSSLDVLVIRPSHAIQDGNLFSARGLCKNVLVPFAVQNNIDLGTRGNDPLNNQPYGRMVKFGDNVPVAKRGIELFRLVETIVLEIDAIKERDEARFALAVLLNKLKKEKEPFLEAVHSLSSLKRDVSALSLNFSEYGRVAQAVIAGIVEAAFGDVKTKLINDPSRRFPGDIQFDLRGSTEPYSKCFIEVRDKVVSATDAQIFFERCKNVGADRAIIFVSTKNETKQNSLMMEGEGFFGCTIIGTDAFIDQIAFWSRSNLHEAPGLIYKHLMNIGASNRCLHHWLRRSS